MHRSTVFAVSIVLALAVAACGDDDAGTVTTAGPEPTASTTDGIPPTTGAPATTAAPGTTAAPATTTTAPADAHQVFGLSWSGVWPPDGSTAVYRIHSWDGSAEDVEARFELGVDFRGETFDRLTIGTAEPGNNAMAVYLDRSEPWKLAIKAVVTYSADFADGPGIIEMFDDPVLFDGSLPIGESAPVETEVILEFGGDQDRIPATYGFELLSLDETVEVPLGTVTGAAYAEGSVTGEEFLGSDEPFAAGMWLHPLHLIVKMSGSPAFDVFEIVETWTR